MWSCLDEEPLLAGGPFAAVKTHMCSLIQFGNLPPVEIPKQDGGAVHTKLIQFGDLPPMEIPMEAGGAIHTKLIQFSDLPPVEIPTEVGRAAVAKAEVLPTPATIVDQDGAAWVAINTKEQALIQFGPFPPVAVFEYYDKTYMHLTQDPVQFQSIQRKKAQ